MNTKKHQCIYCKNYFEESNITESHIIPYALGGRMVWKNSVCKNCNGSINKIVETPVINELALLRNIIGIKNRRGENARIKIKIKYGEFDTIITTSNIGNIENKSIWLQNSSNKDFVLLGKKEEFESVKEDYKRKQPNIRLYDIEEEIKTENEAMIDFSILFKEPCLRLAAKIGFEMIGEKRGKDYIMEKEFDPIRSYIYENRQQENNNTVSIITNNGILEEYRKMKISFGIHSVLVTPTTDRAQIAIVGIFGLVYYKVILQDGYRLLNNLQELVLVNSQTGKGYQPVFRNKYLPIVARDKDYYEDKEKSFEKIYKNMMVQLSNDIKSMPVEELKDVARA